MWSMISNKKLNGSSQVAQWYKAQAVHGLVGVSHDGLFTVFIVTPPEADLVWGKVDLVSESTEPDVYKRDLLAIGASFLNDDAGRILVGTGADFCTLYDTPEYRAWVAKHTEPEVL